MKQAYFKYILALLLFGSNGVVASHIGLTSYEIVLLRSLLGSLLLIVLFFVRGHRVSAFRHKKDMLFIALSGVAMAADWLLLFEAYAQIGVSLGMLINYCGPAIVVAFSPLVFRERVSRQKLAALIAAIVGVFFISRRSRLMGVALCGPVGFCVCRHGDLQQAGKAGYGNGKPCPATAFCLHNGGSICWLQAGTSYGNRR